MPTRTPMNTDTPSTIITYRTFLCPFFAVCTVKVSIYYSPSFKVGFKAIGNVGISNSFDAHRAAHTRVSHKVDLVGVSEVGHVGACRFRRNLEDIGCVCGYGRAAFRPVEEGVAGVGCSPKGSPAVLVILSGAGYRTSIAWRYRSVDCVLRYVCAGEICHQRSGTVYGESIGSRG